MDTSPHLWFCAFKTAIFGPNCMRLWVPDPSPVIFCIQNSLPRITVTSLDGSPPKSVVLYMQNSVFRTTHTSLYGSQTSPAVLCMQNRVHSIRITSLYGSQPSPVVFGCIRVTFGPEQQVSMGPRHQLSFCACTTS